jgi:hypothetical protein
MLYLYEELELCKTETQVVMMLIGMRKDTRNIDYEMRVPCSQIRTS